MRPPHTKSRVHGLPSPSRHPANQPAVLFQEFQRAIFRSQLLDETAHIRRIPARMAIHRAPSHCSRYRQQPARSPPACILAHRARQRLFRLLGQLIECHISDEGKSHRRIHSRVDWNQIRDRLSGCLLVVKHFPQIRPGNVLRGGGSPRSPPRPDNRASRGVHAASPAYGLYCTIRNQKSIILFHQNLVILRLFLIIILDKTLRIFRETHMPEMLVSSLSSMSRYVSTLPAVVLAICSAQ